MFDELKRHRLIAGLLVLGAALLAALGLEATAMLRTAAPAVDVPGLVTRLEAQLDAGAIVTLHFAQPIAADIAQITLSQADTAPLMLAEVSPDFLCYQDATTDEAFVRCVGLDNIIAITYAGES